MTVAPVELFLKELLISDDASFASQKGIIDFNSLSSRSGQEAQHDQRPANELKIGKVCFLLACSLNATATLVSLHNTDSTRYKEKTMRALTHASPPPLISPCLKPNDFLTCPAASTDTVLKSGEEPLGHSQMN